MMIYLLLRHTIEDYGRWKEGFDKHLAARQAGGATKEVYVMRNVDNAQEIIVLLGWHDLAKARAFTNSVSLQTALKQMGVVGVAEVRFLKEVG
jgi:heme-degrading monooxygenase HmoA